MKKLDANELENMVKQLLKQNIKLQNLVIICQEQNMMATELITNIAEAIKDNGCISENEFVGMAKPVMDKFMELSKKKNDIVKEFGGKDEVEEQ